jgi:imidazolonepropionase-like amidohydrolase
MASRGTYWVPTISILRGEIEAQQTWKDRKQRQEEMHPFLGQDERRFGESMKYFHDAWHAVERTLEAMVEAGVPIAVGTDAPLGGLPIDAAANEAAWLVEFGLSPMEAVQAATRNAAEVVGLGEFLGTVEPGKRADLIAVEGNPLEDIGALHNVQLVIKNNEVVHNGIS